MRWIVAACLLLLGLPTFAHSQGLPVSQGSSPVSIVPGGPVPGDLAPRMSRRFEAAVVTDSQVLHCAGRTAPIRSDRPGTTDLDATDAVSIAGDVALYTGALASAVLLIYAAAGKANHVTDVTTPVIGTAAIITAVAYVLSGP